MRFTRRESRAIVSIPLLELPVPQSKVAQVESGHPGLDINIALDIAVRAAAHNTGATAAAIALMENGALVCRARVGDIAPDLGIALNVSTGITGTCVRTGQVLKCDNTEKDERVDADVCRTLHIKSIIAVPILVAGVVRGVLEVLSENAYVFGTLHVHWLERVAAFVRELACGDPIVEPLPKTTPRPEIVRPARMSVPGELSNKAGTPDRAGAPGGEPAEVSAFRELLDSTPPTSSWDHICEQLVSRLKE